MDPNSRRPSYRPTGLLLILVAVLVNAESLAFYLSNNQYIESSGKRGAIVAAQLAALVLGLFFLLAPRVGPAWAWLRHGLNLGALLMIGIGGYGSLRMTGYLVPQAERRQTEQISRMIASESVHLKLTPRFKKLSMAAENLAIPSAGAAAIFADEVVIVDIVGPRAGAAYLTLPNVGARFEGWEVETTERRVARADLDLLRPLLDRVSYFEHAKFGFVAGGFVGDVVGGEWRVAAYFKALAHLEGGDRAQIESHVDVLWRMAAGADASDPEALNDPENWFVAELRFEDLELVRSEYSFFTEELDVAVPDDTALFEARRNITRELLVEKLTQEALGKEWESPHRYWDYRAAYVLPSVSVVDINGDGFDDFYKVPQQGRNQLFVNRGDGTFEERAEDLGLDIDSWTNVGLFADFDNDGDPDLFAGRSLEPSLYLVNDGGRFVDRSAGFVAHMPYWVSTAAAADYDLDGMLDLHVGTYAAQATIRDLNRRKRLGGRILPDFLPEHQARKLFELAVAGMEHAIRDRVGPPNLLLRNTGRGSFELDEGSPTTLYRNTFQGTWADYDEDGDPDLYVANDFALNNLFRNDTAAFVDVTAVTNTGDVGFGMGASWGDHDRDGDQDLYVSNMFSKAGNRILPQVEGLDRRFLDMAAGNSLLSWTGGDFEKVSSTDGRGMHVEVGGWSWGSLYLDADNDGWLDLFVLNGYYSAPRLFRDDVDL